MIFAVPPVIYHEFFGFGRAKGCSLYPILGLHLQRPSHLLLRCANHSLLIIKLSCGVWKIDWDAEGREDVKGGSTHSLLMLVFNAISQKVTDPVVDRCESCKPVGLVTRSTVVKAESKFTKSILTYLHYCSRWHTTVYKAVEMSWCMENYFYHISLFSHNTTKS